MADEDYVVPVAVRAAAAENVIDSLVSNNIVGRKPQLGAPARTTGSWSAEYKSRVLPLKRFYRSEDFPD